MGNKVTRRGFGGLLAGLAAATANAGAFVQHKVLRRPYVESAVTPARERMLHDVVYLRGEWQSPLRITVMMSGVDEPLLQATMTPRPDEARIRLLGLHGARA